MQIRCEPSGQTIKLQLISRTGSGTEAALAPDAKTNTRRRKLPTVPAVWLGIVVRSIVHDYPFSRFPGWLAVITGLAGGPGPLRLTYRLQDYGQIQWLRRRVDFAFVSSFCILCNRLGW